MIELKVGAWEILDFEDSLTNPTTIPLLNIISTKPWEKIVTHNPIGEYGHPQHKTTFISVKQFIDSTNNSENILYVFGKGSNKLNKDILDRKKQLLKIYSSEEDIIDQILHNNGDWFKSNNPNTNYIEFECIEKYNKDRDTTPFIPCYEK
jgi:hypothetical protein